MLGFDWHSSGPTTTVCGALKEGLRGQQGMNDASAMARRYHWLSDNVRSYVNEAHAAVCRDASAATLAAQRPEAPAAAKIGRNEKIHAFRRLSDFSGRDAGSL